MTPSARPKPLRFLSPIHKASRQIAMRLERCVEGEPVAVCEAHVVAYLGSYAPAPVGELVRIFGHKASTMTSMLDRLEDAGIVARVPNPEDRRSSLVDLSADGRSLAARIRRRTEELEADIAKRTTAADRKGFENVMKAIADATGIAVRANPNDSKQHNDRE